MGKGIDQAVQNCYEELRTANLLSCCEFRKMEGRLLVGLKVVDPNKIEEVIGKLYLLKQARKIDSYELLAMFPDNIQIIPKV